MNTTTIMMLAPEDELAEHIWEDEAPMPPGRNAGKPAKPDVNHLLETLSSFEE
jgi:hypothetical protein